VEIASNIEKLGLNFLHYLREINYVISPHCKLKEGRRIKYRRIFASGITQFYENYEAKPEAYKTV
jgi:hypothetical protein